MVHYTTYKIYFKLIKSVADDPKLDKKKAVRALARFVSFHPHNLAQKSEVTVEHFRAFTRHKIGGRAKAMLGSGPGFTLYSWIRTFYVSQSNF
jgi:type I restriction enzyme R subunit